MYREYGSKTGGGGLMSANEEALARKERLRQLALETVDLSKDPFFSRNCHGSFECRLCLTLHPNEGNYLAHTQAKKHQTNLKRRAAREQRLNAFDGSGSTGSTSQRSSTMSSVGQPHRSVIGVVKKEGRPGYRVSKHWDEESGRRCVLFSLHYPKCDVATCQPRHRLLGAYAQRVESPDVRYQYVVFACHGYESVAFKVPSWQVERDVVTHQHYVYSDWDKKRKVFTLQLMFIPPQHQQQHQHQDDM